MSPEALQCDVLVVGGGITGVAAATAAARGGASTVLLENKPFVGGNATTGLCLHSYITRYGEQAVFGIAQELVDRLIERGGAVGHIPYGGFVHSVTPVDGDLFRIVATEVLAEAGVVVLYGVNAVGVESDDGTVKAVQVAMKNQLRPVHAKTVIDATGDADVAVAAGAQYRKGEERTGKMQPVSMLLRCFGTDNAKIFEAVGEGDAAWATRPDYPDPLPVYFRGSFGRWNDLVLRDKIFPNKDHMVFFNTVWPNQINVNTTAVFGVDGTDPLAMSRATVELTRQAARIGEFLKANVPGFEGTYYVPAAFAGVRQTRNVLGHYEITRADIEAGREFEDGIGQGCFPVDIHDPDTGQASFVQIGGDGTYDIPLRSLIPTGLSNVLVAGRCISADHVAHGATRNMVACLTSGEAAGVAASIAAERDGEVPAIDVGELQQELARRGVRLSSGSMASTSGAGSTRS
ncbi:MAG TPA: FAD-dependent oxidoreductase [Solirubrobacteraceae bacterium]